MVIITKVQRRAAERWKRLLELHERGISVKDLAKMEDVTTTQIYALLQKARECRLKGWI